MAGGRLADVPTWTGDINLNYLTPISDKYSFNASVEPVFTGNRNRVDLSFPAGVTDTETPVPSYTLTHLRAGITSRDAWNAVTCRPDST